MAISSHFPVPSGVFPVKAAIGSIVWSTSIFPHNNYYLLALKAEVRKKENIKEGDQITLNFEIKDDIFN